MRKSNTDGPTGSSGMEDAALLRELMDCTVDAVMLLGDDLSIRRANRSAAALTGYPVSELLTMCLPETLQPKERRRMRAAIKESTRRHGGKSVVRHRAGIMRPIKYSVSPAIGDRGLVTGYLFVCRPWMSGGTSAAAATARRKMALECIDEPVFIVDSASRAILDVNKCAVIFSGYRPSDIIGRALFDFLSAGDGEGGEECLRGIIDAAYARRGVFIGVVKFERKGGALVSCDCYSLLILKDDGRPDYLVVAMIDRTAADRREIALEEFSRRAARFSSELADFVQAGSARRDGKRLSDLGFTPRQVEIARLVFEGRPSKEVGRLLGITESTVKNHIAAMFKKLGASSRVDFLHKLVEERIWIA